MNIRIDGYAVKVLGIIMSICTMIGKELIKAGAPHDVNAITWDRVKIQRPRAPRRELQQARVAYIELSPEAVSILPNGKVRLQYGAREWTFRAKPNTRDELKEALATHAAETTSKPTRKAPRKTPPKPPDGQPSAAVKALTGKG